MQVRTRLWGAARRSTRKSGSGCADLDAAWVTAQAWKLHIAMSACASEQRLLVRSSTLSSPPPVGTASFPRPRWTQSPSHEFGPSLGQQSIRARAQGRGLRGQDNNPTAPLSSSMPSWDGRLSPARAVESDRLWKAPAHHPPAPGPSHSRRKSRPRPLPAGIPAATHSPGDGPGRQRKCTDPHPREVEASLWGRRPNAPTIHLARSTDQWTGQLPPSALDANSPYRVRDRREDDHPPAR